MKKSIDIWIYAILSALLVIYALFIKTTCEELGCLAIIIPIIGIFIISGIEFIISLIFVFIQKKIKISRLVVLILTGLISAFAVAAFILGTIR